MKIFVISMKDSIDRRKKIVEDFSGLPFSFFDAESVDATSNHCVYDFYSPEKCLRYKGYYLTASEIGCFASHISLWYKCVSENEIFLIMEDNVKLLSDLSFRLSEIENNARIYGIVKLANFFQRKHVVFNEIDENNKIVSNLRGGCGTSAYVISPDVANKYIGLLKDFFEPVDDFIEAEWRTRIIVYSYYPALAKRDDIKSVIGKRKIKLTGGFPALFRIELYRAYKKVRTLLYNCRFKFFR